MIRLRSVAMTFAVSVLFSGVSSAQVVGDWTGNGSTSFNDAASWYQGVVPNGTIVMGFSPDFSTGGSGNSMMMNVAGSALGIDVESSSSAGMGGNISIGGASLLTLGASGIAMNQTFNLAASVLFISAPLKLSASQTWNIIGSDMTISNTISESSAGTSVTITGSGANIQLNSANSTFSGGLHDNATSGTVLVLDASSVGPAGSPTSGPVGTGTLTLAGNAQLFSAATLTVTLANNITVGSGVETIDGGAGGDIKLTGTISGAGKIQAVNSSSSVEFDGDNNFTGGTALDFATVTVGNDHGLGTGPATMFGNTVTFSSNDPGMGVPSFSFQQCVVNFTAGGGEPILDNLTFISSQLNFAGASIISITDVTSDSSGSTNVLSLNSNSVLGLQINSPIKYYGTITGAGSNMIVNSAGTGSLDLFGANTYSGTTTIDANVVVVADNNSALGTGSITVNGGGLGIAPGITLTNLVSNSNGSTFAGYGTLAPASGSNFLLIQHGGYITGGKGSSASFASQPVPGTLTIGSHASITLGNAGSMQFSIMNATGTPGTDFSTISAPNSTVSVTAATTPFTIQLVSVSPSTTQMGLANFNNALSYSWTLLSAQSISGFSTSDFTIDDTTFFQNALGGGTFSISDVSNDLVLSFTPVPEPSTWLLMATGLCTLAAAVRRRR